MFNKNYQKGEHQSKENNVICNHLIFKVKTIFYE